MTSMTDKQRSMLREALGLSFYQTTPTKNHLSAQKYAGDNPDIIAMVYSGLLQNAHTYGQGGVEHYYTVTEKGKAIALGTYLEQAADPLVDDTQPFDMGACCDDDGKLIDAAVCKEDIAPLRPSAGEIIEHLCIHYEASEDTVTQWLRDLVKDLDA